MGYQTVYGWKVREKWKSEAKPVKLSPVRKEPEEKGWME